MSINLRTIFILNLLFMSSILSIETLNKYGSTSSLSGTIYLDVSGFDDGETIYISTTVYYNCHNELLYYRFYESNSNTAPSATTPVSWKSSSYTETYNSYEEKFNYEIQKQSGLI